MIQELIPGGDDELYTLGSYLDASGTPLGLFSGRKLRQTPPNVGTCRVGEAVWVQEVVDAGLRLLAALSFTGLSQVEFKRDPRDGRFKLMEINPRLFQWHGLAAACGVDLPALAYWDLLGAPRPAARMNGPNGDSNGKRWAISFLAKEGPALQRPPYVDAVFARDDLRPAAVYAGAPSAEPRPLTSETVERRARWVLDTIGARDLVPGEDVPYDELADAFLHLARVEERERAARRARPLPCRRQQPRPARPAARAPAPEPRPRAAALAGSAIRGRAHARRRRAVAVDAARGSRLGRAAEESRARPSPLRGRTRGARPRRAPAAQAPPQRPELALRRDHGRRARARRLAPRSSCSPATPTRTTGRRRRRTTACGRGSWRRCAREEARSACTGATSRRATRRGSRRRSGLLESLGADVRGQRYHYLRVDPHENLAPLAELGLRYDTTLGFSDAIGFRAGIMQPFRPWDHARERPLDLVEIPLAAMDVTLGESRYLGLTAREAERPLLDLARPRGRARRRLLGPLAHRPLRPWHRAGLGHAVRAVPRRRASSAAACFSPPASWPTRPPPGSRRLPRVPSLASARRSLSRAVRAAVQPARRRLPPPPAPPLRGLPRRARRARRATSGRSPRAASSTTSAQKRSEYDALLAASGREGYTTGAIGLAERMYLYALVRHLKPTTAVETGVANGFSTAFLLLALDRNGEGHLHSIDLPRIVGEDDQIDFYEGEGRAGVPPEHLPGWLIPDHLRERWTLRLGKSQDELPPLLESLPELDFFMHDSEHSYECMSFEFGRAWPRLREGGVLVSDDVNSTAAFPELSARVGREPIAMARGMAFLVK